MKKLCIILCLLAWPSMAADLAETGDLAPTMDLSTDPDILKPRVKSAQDAKIDRLMRQMEPASASPTTRAEQSIYQNQLDASRAAASTVVLPAGAIPGVQGSVTVVTPPAGG